ncbi:MAG TPA: type II secretion system F family protein [Nitrolancea sp.]|jgi:tight adherence protein C|nr:type II secretion system F family protein [Nitrolancea sp.]
MSMMILLVAIIFIVLAVAAVLVGVRRPQKAIVIEERLAQFGNRVPSLEEVELQQPFQDRVILPMLRTTSIRMARFAPSKNVNRLRQQLLEAGAPKGLGPTEFTGLRFVIGGGLGGLFLVFMLISRPSILMVVGAPFGIAALGYMMPGIWLSRRIKQRKTEITRALPDAIDLLTISVEAGLGFDPALGRVVEKWDNGLTRELGRMLSEMRMGSSRRDAMREVANRVNVEDLNTFISAVIQADQLGVSISQVLRVQSKQMRQRRRQRAEEQAHKAPLKMLFPMIFLIFPSIYIVILGPAIPRIVQAFH